MFNEEIKVNRLAAFFKTLGDITRIKILAALQDGEMSVQDIADALGMSQPAISHQLRILRQEQLVINKREGRKIFYSIYDSHVHSILKQGMDHISHT